jgi:cell wall-associated NlpC family hydrolase
MAAVLTLGSCASAPVTMVEPPLVHIDTAIAAADTAEQLIGAPYRYGGMTPAGFDCSGLVYYSFLQAGLRLPRTSQLLLQAAIPVPLNTARRGDLLFFDIEGKAAHVAIYLGNRRFVHAPASGRSVEIATLDNPYYLQHFHQAGRVE